MVEITYEPELQPNSRAAIVEGLMAFNASKTADFDGPVATIGLTLTNPETGVIDGGLAARIGYAWMFVELLFVPERLRGQGIGRDLMLRAEAVAREKGCVGSRLDTFSFQARVFYEKLGYSVFGEITDCPPGHSRYFLHKQLS